MQSDEFYRLLNQSKELNQSTSKEQDQDTCLISGLPLDDQATATLQCGHVFGYHALFREIYAQKYVIKSYNIKEFNDDGYYQHFIRCPYCRHEQFDMLPSLDVRDWNSDNQPSNNQPTEPAADQIMTVPFLGINVSTAPFLPPLRVIQWKGMVFSNASRKKCGYVDHDHGPCHVPLVHHFPLINQWYCQMHAIDGQMETKAKALEDYNEKRMKNGQCPVLHIPKPKTQEQLVRDKQKQWIKGQGQKQDQDQKQDQEQSVFIEPCKAILQTGMRQGQSCTYMNNGRSIFCNRHAKKHNLHVTPK